MKIDKQSKGNVEFYRIPIDVDTEAGQIVEFSIVTEIDHRRIIGVMQQFSDETAIPGSILQMDVDGVEIFPTGFESALIYSDESVAPDDRFMKYINREINQVRIKGKFTDGSAQAAFAAYTAHIYLLMRTDKFISEEV